MIHLFFCMHKSFYNTPVRRWLADISSWEFVQPVYMSFVDVEKTFAHIPRGVLYFRNMGLSALVGIELLCSRLFVTDPKTFLRL